MKTFGRILTLIVLFSLFVSCAPAATQPPAAPQAPAATQVAAATKAPAATEVLAATMAPAATEEALSPAQQWAKANGVGPYQTATEDWAAVEAAANKEGSVCVYANSSKFEKLQDAWNALYPSIKLDCGDTDGITTKMRAEQEAGNVVGDVWFNSDGHILYGEFMPNNWIWSYVPAGLTVNEVTPERPFALSRRSVDLWGYNQEVHPDGCPVNNWWQLTEPAYKGKIFMEDPISDPSTTAKITLVVEHADEMAATYQDLYGKAWTTDELAAADAFGAAPENAGYLWLKKIANNVVLEPGGDEVDTAFASLGMDKAVEPGMGLTGYSSYQTTLDGELAMAPCLGMKPVVGILKANYLGIANQSKHPNAAKLFIKFALSPDGFKPWRQMGTYPAADGLTPIDGMPTVETVGLWSSDDAFAWKNNSTVRDFWAVNLLAAPK